jgi:cell division protein FtsI (penicillin-binding protein 3)
MVSFCFMRSILKLKPQKYKTTTLIMQALFLFFACLLVFKLFELQIIDPQNLKEKAKSMRMSKAFVFRGDIVDRNGVKLATDSTLYDIYAHPQYYADMTPEEIASKVAPYLNISKSALTNKLKEKHSTITLAKGIERNVIQDITKLGVKGLDLVKRNTRVYPQNNLASHILGYINPNANITAGVEHTGDRQVEDAKTQYFEKNGKGDVIYGFSTDPEVASKPVEGQKLVLTIDSTVQHIAEIELAKMVKKTNADRGSVIVMNPNNGEILAFAVLPTYNPNEYSKVNSSVIKNWVLSDVYPPGSTFKIFTVASALENHKITKNERLLDTGRITVQGWPIENYDYSKHPHPGLINLEYLFEHSSNVGSVKVALKMTPDEFYNQLAKFGMGSKTGIDLPGESSGILPPTSTWDQSRHATIGFGYSIATTPIQMIAAASAIANGGTWITPHVIKYSEEDYEKKIKKITVLSPETCSAMKEVLEESIRKSKGTAGKIPNFTVAGKTGTSRKPNPNGPGYLKDQLFTSFVGFFPSQKPDVIMMVIVDNAKGGGIWGSTIAGPVFNEIASQVTRILGLKPDAPGLNVKHGT